MTGSNDQDGVHPRLPPEDERLMDRLRDLLRTVDDVPEAVRAAARDAYAPPSPSSSRDGGHEPREA